MILLIQLIKGIFFIYLFLKLIINEFKQLKNYSIIIYIGTTGNEKSINCHMELGIMNYFLKGSTNQIY